MKTANDQVSTDTLPDGITGINTPETKPITKTEVPEDPVPEKLPACLLAQRKMAEQRNRR